MRRFFEQIEWRAAAEVLPDDGESILICAEDEVGEGFAEGGEWFWASGGGVVGEVLWCPMPEGRGA